MKWLFKLWKGDSDLQEPDLCLPQFHPCQLSMHSAELSRNHSDSWNESAIVRLSGQKLNVPNSEGQKIDTNNKIFQYATNLNHMEFYFQ